MYSTLLAVHSLLRWLMLFTLLYALFRAYAGWLGGQSFRSSDGTVRLMTVIFAHIQLIIGLWLYFISPITGQFLSDFKEGMRERSLRFFGMEHILMMVIAVILITIGSAAAKRKANDQAKFKTLAIWFTLALLLILASIPWEFMASVGRPYFRGF